MIGTTEILLLAGVALLIFGGKKLPEMMRNMGKGVKEFQEGVKGAPQDFRAGLKEEEEGNSPASRHDDANHQQNNNEEQLEDE